MSKNKQNEYEPITTISLTTERIKTLKSILYFTAKYIFEIEHREKAYTFEIEDHKSFIESLWYDFEENKN